VKKVARDLLSRLKTLLSAAEAEPWTARLVSDGHTRGQGTSKATTGSSAHSSTTWSTAKESILPAPCCRGTCSSTSRCPSKRPSIRQPATRANAGRRSGQSGL